MNRNEFKKLTELYRKKLKDISNTTAEEQQKIDEFFDSIRALEQLFHFEKTFEIKKHTELNFKDLISRVHDPVYDAISCCWLIVEKYEDDEIFFNDGTSVKNDTSVLKGRFYDCWQDLNEDQLFTRSLLRRTESYEMLAEIICGSSESAKKKTEQLQEIVDELKMVQEYVSTKNDRNIVDNSIICLETMMKSIKVEEEKKYGQ